MLVGCRNPTIATHLETTVRSLLAVPCRSDQRPRSCCCRTVAGSKHQVAHWDLLWTIYICHLPQSTAAGTAASLATAELFHALGAGGGGGAGAFSTVFESKVWVRDSVHNSSHVCSGSSFPQHTTLTTASEADVSRGANVVDAFPIALTSETSHLQDLTSESVPLPWHRSWQSSGRCSQHLSSTS